MNTDFTSGAKPCPAAGDINSFTRAARAGRHPAGPLTSWLACAMCAMLWPGLQTLAQAAETAPPAAAAPLRGAAVDRDSVPHPDAQRLAERIVASGDHAQAPFIIVDKKRAVVLVFDADARLRAHSAVLLGLALGDDSVPGIGDRPMAQILPAERTTPAGRFVAERGTNAQGEDIIWVDYDAAVSMHRVRTGNALERRAERLHTPTVTDNRISYGCINVPVAFYNTFIQPMFAVRRAMVYVLPDSRSLQEVFGALQAAPHDTIARKSARGPVPVGKGASANGKVMRVG